MTPSRDGPVPPGARYTLLDGLRGLAAVIIVIHHFTAMSGMHETFASASIAVDFFFCLGGFVIAHTYHRRLLAGMTLRDYASRRLLRLYPMFLVGCAIGFLALVLGKTIGTTDLSWGDIEGAAVLNSLYMPFPNRGYLEIFHFKVAAPLFPLNGPAWSLFFALLANAIYAVVIRRSLLAPAFFMAAAGVAMLATGTSLGEAPGWGTFNMLGGLSRVMFAFFAGVVIFQLQPHLQRLPRIPARNIAAFAVLMLAVPRFPGHFYYWLGASFIAVPLLVALAARHTTVDPPWREVCSFSASMSYPIFCVHYPLLMLFAIAFGARVSPSLLAIYVVTTLVVSYLLLRYVERPMRAWLRARTAQVAT